MAIRKNIMQIDSDTACVAKVPDHSCVTDQNDINFVEVAESHMEWRGRLISYIEGKYVDPATCKSISSEECCSLGVWLQGSGLEKFSDLSSFRRLALEHAQFHSFAGMIISRVQEEELHDAEMLLKNEFSQATRRILLAISELNEVMQKHKV
jgi:hypothetical protein